MCCPAGYYGGQNGQRASYSLLSSGGLAQRMGQAVIMTQRKCDFILTLMLGLQTAIEPDLIWKRERAREKEEARRALEEAEAAESEEESGARRGSESIDPADFLDLN